MGVITSAKRLLGRLSAVRGAASGSRRGVTGMGGHGVRDILMLPGPTDIPEESYEAMGRRLINHRGGRFRELHTHLIEKLKRIVGTRYDVFLLTCSGTGGIEAAVSNVVRRGDRVLAFVGGQFGERLASAASYYTDVTARVVIPWNRAPTPEDVRRALEENVGADVVLVVHNETSTGTFTPRIEEIAGECRRAGALLVLDAVTSLGGVPFNFDSSGVDVLVAGTQKCLAGPPGLSLIAVSRRAWEKIESLERRPAYFDLVAHRDFMERGETPYTPAISLFYGLDASATRILETGLDVWIDRHRRGARAFYNALDGLGLETYPLPEFRSQTLIAVMMPEGLRDSDVAERMAEKYGVHVGTGVARERGRMIRIGNMGLVSAERTRLALRALCGALGELGLRLDYGLVEEVVEESFSG